MIVKIEIGFPFEVDISSKSSMMLQDAIDNICKENETSKFTLWLSEGGFKPKACIDGIPIAFDESIVVFECSCKNKSDKTVKYSLQDKRKYYEPTDN